MREASTDLHQTFRDFGLSFLGLFVALDIIGLLPIYVGMTQRLTLAKRNAVVNLSMAVALVVALALMLAGERLFGFLGITLFDFKIAGGLILLLVAIADLVTTPEAAHRFSGNTGIVPLAVPLITGPAVITTSILHARSLGYGVTIAALLLNYLIAWLVMRWSDYMTRILGRDGTVVFSKIAALLLAAIAVSMMRSGVFEAIAQFRAEVSR